MIPRPRTSLAALFAATLLLLTSCGGDSSAPVSTPIPALESASPAQLVAGTGPTKLTLKGNNFVAESRARWNDADRPTTFVSSSTLTIDVSAADLATISEATVTVVNPAPGGGSSGAVKVPIGYPVPIVTSISPSSTDAGRSLSANALLVEITGSNFVPESFPYWEGYVQLPRTNVTPTSITAVIPSDYVAFGGTHGISVINPSPGGGESNRVPFQTTNPLPVISTVTPNPAVTGQAFTMMIVGTGLTRSSVVQWNGAERTTRYDVGNLYVDIPASDVSAAGAATITVVNPAPGGGTSAPVTLPIREAPLSITGTIDVANVDVAGDSTRAVLYASVPSSGGAMANTILKIDPATATILGSLFVGSDPGKIVITDDDRYLYVALRGAPKIVRIALATFTKDIEFDPGSAFGSTTGYADELVVLPGLPNSVVALVRNNSVVMFDDGVARVNSSASMGRGVGNRIVRGPTASYVYGYNDVSTGFEFFSNRVAADGLQLESTRGGLISGFSVKLAYDGGLIYTTNGAVVDPVALTRVGTLPPPTFGSPVFGSTAVLPDAKNGRVHFLTGSTWISTYSTSTLTEIDRFVSSAMSSHSTLTRWGPDGIAVGGGTTIVLAKGKLIAP